MSTYAGGLEPKELTGEAFDRDLAETAYFAPFGTANSNFSWVVQS